MVNSLAQTKLKSGVPQGTVLGPHFPLIYVGTGYNYIVSWFAVWFGHVFYASAKTVHNYHFNALCMGFIFNN